MPFLSIILIVLHTCIGMIQYSIFSLQQHFNIRDSGGLPSRRAENRSDRSRQRTCIWDQTRPSYLGRKRPERSWMYSSTYFLSLSKDPMLPCTSMHRLCVGILYRSFIRNQSFGRQPPTSRTSVVGLMTAANRHLHACMLPD
jgi:hypothetical protein